MKFIFKINNAIMVKHISKDDFYYLNKDKLLAIHYNAKTEIVNNSIKCEVVEEWNFGLLINENIYYNYSNFESLFKESNTYKSLIVSNNKLLIKKIDFVNEKIIFGIYNYINHLISWIEFDKNVNPYLFISNNTFISYLKSGIENFDLNGNLNWHYTFSSLLNVVEVIISNEIVEVSGVIYFLLHGGGKHECFGLDANTGEVVKRIPNILGDIIVENEFIYFLHAETITIYNTQKDEIITWEIENLMIEKGIERLWFPRWAIDNGLIYFSQSKGADRNSDSVGARFGVLDPTKKELLWQDKLPLENGIIGSIKVNQNRIYLHTQDQTLFIYEKE